MSKKKSAGLLKAVLKLAARPLPKPKPGRWIKR